MLTEKLQTVPKLRKVKYTKKKKHKKKIRMILWNKFDGEKINEERENEKCFIHRKST